MKKVISLKEIVLILISILVIGLLTSTSVFAINLVNQDEYQNAQQVSEGNNVKDSTNTQSNLNVGNNINNNSNNNNSVLPQTGIEDYNVGILLIICVGSAIFAYKKINDYKNI